MKRAAFLILFSLTGCSTAPVADLLDFFAPGHIGPDAATPYGGVCVPRQVGGVLPPPPQPTAAPPLVGAVPAVPPPPPPGSAPPPSGPPF